MLQKDLLKRAKSYVPEWNQDLENKDLGMALIELFSYMHEDTLGKYQLKNQKSRIELLNHLHTSQKPKKPAKGYVHFGLSSDDVEGTELPANTLLRTAKTFADGSEIPIETQEDVFVTPANLGTVVECGVDYIGKLNVEEGFPFLTFRGENLQDHSFYFSHSSALYMEKQGELSLTFWKEQHEFVDMKWLDILKECVEFSYSSEKGFEPFKKVERKNHSLILTKTLHDPPMIPMELDGLESCFLKCHVKDAMRCHAFGVRDILMGSKANMIPPEDINAAGIQVASEQEFFPFTERPSIYEEVYFASKEVLSKRGALVELSFIIEYGQVYLENTNPSEVTWKLVMPKQNVKQETTYDITIQEVIFEYFNGNGYVNLFKTKEYRDVFGTDHGIYRKKQSIRFVCPSDIQPTIVGGVEGYYIRARILKMNNELKNTAQYITPILSQVYFAYQYPNLGVRPEYIMEHNNLQQFRLTGSECLEQIQAYHPIKLTGDDCPTLYLGFDKPLDRGPIRILFDILKTKDEPLPELVWEFYGKQGFHDLNVADETENFKHSGLVTFQECKNHTKAMLFGQEQYYIRISDPSCSYQKKTMCEVPQINHIYLNSVKVMTVKTGVEAYFTYEDYEDELTFDLEQSSIFEVEVYVNETATLTEAEESILEHQIEYREVDGMVEKWVRWQEIDDFTSHTKGKRCYHLDINRGILTFSRQFMLPAPKVYHGIRVKMSIGGGNATNLQPEEIHALDLTTGFINQVSNPLPLFGGTDTESIKQTERRKWAEYKHQFRAVTARDYEKLVEDYSSDIHKAKCFTNMTGIGEYKTGHVSVVVLNKEYEKSNYYFASLQQELFDYLQDKVFANLILGGRLHIVSPNFVKIHVKVEVVLKSLQNRFEVKRQVETALNQFLNPIQGNFTKKGFAIGSVPNRRQIESVLIDLKQIEVIKSLILTGEMQEGDKTVYINMDEIENIPFVLPLSGQHSVHVYVE